MGTVVANLGESIGRQLQPFVDLPKVTVTATAIQNRAQCTDFSQDLMPRMGVERIMVCGLIPCPGEYGANQEQVHKPINDIHDQFRFVGGWSIDPVSNSGVGAAAGNGPPSYFEITFYGTGLNVLVGGIGASADWRATVDGGTEGANFITFASTYSTVQNSQNINENQVINAVNGLALGLHTVKIRRAAAGGGFFNLYGVEVLTVSGSSPNVLQLVPGSAYSGSLKSTATALSVDSYNSNFESGTLGTKGGHAVIYMKQGGTIAKAVTPTDASQLTLTSTSHANEDLIRQIHWREFVGIGARTSDLSKVTTTGTGSFVYVLDDGTTALSCLNIQYDSTTFVGLGETIVIGQTNGTITLTFVGTGLDIYATSNLASGFDPHSVTIDGSTLGTNITALPNGVAGQPQVIKIASGLAFGTHVVQFKRTSTAGAGLFFSKFFVYGPKKPTVPTNAVELADYYVMANYSINFANGFNPQVNSIQPSNGTLLKWALKEAIYSGTWSVGSLDAANNYGQTVLTNTTGDFVEFTFYGTGLEINTTWSTSTPNVIVRMDGSLYTGAATVSTGNTWTPGTSTWVFGSLAARMSITGLSLGKHTIRLTFNGGGTNPQMMSFAPITPIYAYKFNGPGLVQNMLEVGSCSISDNRDFSPLKVDTPKAWCATNGINTSPNTSNSTVYTPVGDLFATIKTSGRPIEITYSMAASNNTSGFGVDSGIYVDGMPVNGGNSVINATSAANNALVVLTNTVIVPVEAGVHVVHIAFLASPGGVATSTGTRRTLKVREI